MARLRFILVTYPAQGHINPTLQFANRLTSAVHGGADVTFAIPLHAYRLMTANGSESDPNKTIETSNGSVITFAPFSIDGYDSVIGDDRRRYLSEMKRCGTRAVRDLVVSGRNDGLPYSFLVYTLLLPWAGVAADSVGLPSAMLWIQPATVFALYYRYFYGCGDLIREVFERGDCCRFLKTTIVGLSLEFSRRDFPSFMDHEGTYHMVMESFEEQFEMIESRKEKRIILVNSFDELEGEALGAVSGVNLIGIGSLIPSAYFDEKDCRGDDKVFRGDLFERSKDDYIEWLNSKNVRNVVYVSFGSLLDLPKEQMKEIAKGLLDFCHPFLWVIKEKSHHKYHDDDVDDNDNDELINYREELLKLGMIVTWCSQVEVLCNQSIGCFVSHCGWNSTLESLAAGVPVIAFPIWSDQGTNAKLIEDAWKTGARVNPNENGIVESDEIKRCLELVMGENEDGAEIRRNAMKWKDLTREATKKDGSSDKNLKSFVAEMVCGTTICNDSINAL
ncbi:phloretin 4'-O-glucosyltransferase [Cannabis sativa]|uniref:phloretin 4'-O-glucosyltransferase n=1 Tax=Cannabis sativa TaxID=3483 RepID=UPI0029CA4C17|nr:phloretin 4'-O-glucosyltransferase [Cannabis sativa]